MEHFKMIKFIIVICLFLNLAIAKCFEDLALSGGDRLNFCFEKCEEGLCDEVQVFDDKKNKIFEDISKKNIFYESFSNSLKIWGINSKRSFYLLTTQGAPKRDGYIVLIKTKKQLKKIGFLKNFELVFFYDIDNDGLPEIGGYNKDGVFEMFSVTDAELLIAKKSDKILRIINLFNGK